MNEKFSWDFLLELYKIYREVFINYLSLKLLFSLGFQENGANNELSPALVDELLGQGHNFFNQQLNGMLFFNTNRVFLSKCNSGSCY